MGGFRPTQVAASTPFDGEDDGFVSDNTRDAIVEARDSGDFHAGWDTIIDGQTVTVTERKQMRVFAGLEVCGTLNIQGTVVIE